MTLALTTAPDPTDTLQATLAALARHALDMLDRLRAAIAGIPSDRPAPPKTLTANPTRARHRVQGAVLWLAALMRTLRGDLTYIKCNENSRKPFNKRGPSNHPKPTAERTHRRDLERRYGQTRRIRNSFDKDPVGKIIERLCARIGIKPGDENYPAALIAITETPKQYCNRVIHDRLAKILARANRTLKTLLPCDLLEAIYGPHWNAPRRRPKPPF